MLVTAFCWVLRFDDSDVAALNPGADIPELRETLEDLDVDVWTGATGEGVLSRRAEPYYGTLRIDSRQGYTSVSRAFGRDHVSIRVKVPAPEGECLGKASETAPMAALYPAARRFRW